MSEKGEVLLKLLLEALENTDSKVANDDMSIPVGISNRHIHLSQADLETLFGPGYQLTPIKDLKQPGQFACKETLTICGPKGAIEKVRILGPVRGKSQIEVLKGDCIRMGTPAVGRQSGDLDGSPGITLIGPRGSVQTKEGLIVALRHIHMLPNEAAKHGVKDGDVVSIKIEGERGGILENVLIRSNDKSALECHLDTEEANAMGLTPTSTITIVK